MTESSTKDNKRLPCRGCTSECKNYEFCDGRLWRQTPAEVNETKVLSHK